MELFNLRGNIAIDNTEANNAIDETTKKAKISEKDIKDVYSKIGNAAKGLALGVGGAGLAMGGAFVAAVEGTREYRTEMGLLDSSFLSAGHTSEEAKNTYSDLNAVMGDSGAAVEAAQHIALIADNEKEMNQWTDIAAGVFSSFGSSLPLEGMFEAINHSSKLGEVQGSLADALEWSGITVDDFNKELEACNSEEERQELIMNTLNGVYADASDQYKKTNADIMESRKAQERLTDAIAEVGAVGEPILTAIRNAIASLAEKAAPALETLIAKIKEASKWVKENRDTIEQWTGIILGAAASIGTFLLILNWSGIMSKAAAALNFVKTAVMGFNMALAANPIGLVVAAIVGLVAAFIYLWNNVDGFRQFWIDTWNKIKEISSVAWNAIKEVSSSAWESIKSAWNSTKQWFSDIWGSIKNTADTALKAVIQFFKNAWTNIKNAWNSTKTFFDNIWNGIRSIFSAVASWFGSIFQNAWNNIKYAFNVYKTFFSGIWSGIKNIFNVVASWFGNIFKNAWTNIKNAFNVYKNFFSGVWSGIKKIFNVVASWFGNIFKNAWTNIKNAFNVYKTFFSGIWSGIKNIFNAVASWFGNIFKNAWNNIKNAFNAYKTYFNNVWSGIKNIFNSVSSWFGKIFSNAWKSIKNAFSGWGTYFGNLWNQIKSKFSSIGSTLGSTMSNAVKTGMNAIIGKIESTINKGIRLINSAIKLANKLGFSVGTVGELKLPRLAKGGIINRPTSAILGEAGAEAVIPLENNAGWLSKVASDLNDLQSKDTKEITIKLDQVIKQLEKLTDRKIYLDSKVVVGELAPAMNRKLGDIYTREHRTR